MVLKCVLCDISKSVSFCLSGWSCWGSERSFLGGEEGGVGVRGGGEGLGVGGVWGGLKGGGGW